jgi:hypothetical protein
MLSGCSVTNRKHSCSLNHGVFVWSRASAIAGIVRYMARLRGDGGGILPERTGNLNVVRVLH